MKKIPINNPKLISDMCCMRSGSTQLFRKKGLDNKFTTKVISKRVTL